MSNSQRRVALVTGAAQGIGRACAVELSRLGATVVLVNRNKIKLHEAEVEITRGGGHAMAFTMDVADEESVKNGVAAVLEKTGRVDILVNNAGITRDKSIRKMTDEDWDAVIETNLNSVFYCTSAALPGMIEQKYGRIVNIASFVGQAGNFGQANYAASKGGIIAMTKVLAMELAKFNITANVIAPGFTQTDMLAGIPIHISEQIRSRIPMQRFGLPAEIAKAALFLVCDADYITGQQINVNGGIYM